MTAAVQHVAAWHRCRTQLSQNGTLYYAALAGTQQKFIDYIANTVWHGICV
jgi:hypothetical protein